MDRMVVAGKVSGLFGAGGELTLTLYDDFPLDYDMEEPVCVKIDTHTVPLFFERFARRGKRSATAVFADIDTPERAAELVGREFSIRVGGGRASDGVDDDELYFEDLVGWEAQLGEWRTGRITEFFDSDMNPLLEITLDGVSVDDDVSVGSGRNAESETVLIPAQEEFIAGIDENDRRVMFDLPEGLIGLNK